VGFSGRIVADEMTGAEFFWEGASLRSALPHDKHRAKKRRTDRRMNDLRQDPKKEFLVLLHERVAMLLFLINTFGEEVDLTGQYSLLPLVIDPFQVNPVLDLQLIHRDQLPLIIIEEGLLIPDDQPLVDDHRILNELDGHDDALSFDYIFVRSKCQRENGKGEKKKSDHCFPGQTYSSCLHNLSPFRKGFSS
jgi:hypothetical protein